MGTTFQRVAKTGYTIGMLENDLKACLKGGTGITRPELIRKILNSDEVKQALGELNKLLRLYEILPERYVANQIENSIGEGYQGLASAILVNVYVQNRSKSGNFNFDRQKFGELVKKRLDLDAPLESNTIESLVDAGIDFDKLLSGVGILSKKPTDEQKKFFAEFISIIDKLIQSGRDKDRVFYNFSYAIEAIGIDKTVELHKKLGIEYFMRYSKKVLEEVYANTQVELPTKKPVLLVTANKNDPIGAFSDLGVTLEDLTKHYRLIITETDSEDGFYDIVPAIANKYGEIDTLIIAGHGAPTSILLGEKSDKGRLDLTDEDHLESLKYYFGQHSKVILAACSSGVDERSVGALISRALNVALIAPTKNVQVPSYDLDQEGRIVDVKYEDGRYEEVHHTRYSGGVIPKKLKKS
ncbi:hypothetical protein J4450_05260 [Candidatus Micrarchaeota archaeon]|nr:hypothetical protein [Candidatus Micrarchaeota archaeon]